MMASSKGPWEARTLMLINPVTAFYHKCSDGPKHGGRAKLDLIGSTTDGEAFIIEVKQAPERVKTQDWLSWKPKADATTLSTLQRLELTEAVENGMNQVWIFVGINNILYVFDFERMEGNYGKDNPWPLPTARHIYLWTGPKSWADYKWNWG